MFCIKLKLKIDDEIGKDHLYIRNEQPHHHVLDITVLLTRFVVSFFGAEVVIYMNSKVFGRTYIRQLTRR